MQKYGVLEKCYGNEEHSHQEAQVLESYMAFCSAKHSEYFQNQICVFLLFFF